MDTQGRGWFSRMRRQPFRTAGTTLLAFLAMVLVVAAAGYDFTPPETVDVINDAVFRGYNPESASGSGVFDSFLRVKRSNMEIVQGYNTDGTLEYQTDSYSRAIHLWEVPVRDDDYTGELKLYREFQLDINQVKSYKNTGKISAENGNTLIGSARDVISALFD